MNPHFPRLLFQFLGQAYFMMERFDEAITAFQRRITRDPNTDSSHLFLATIYGREGRIDEARAEWDVVMRVNPDFKLEERIKVWPFRRPADLERIVGELRNADCRLEENTLTGC